MARQAALMLLQVASLRAMPKLLLIWLVLVADVHSIQWLSMLKSTSVGSETDAGGGSDVCQTLNGISRKQAEICRRNHELMDAVRIGGELAIHECKDQFRSSRWNCSALDGVVFGKSVNDGTREAAFVHAITSAGVAYAVTRICSSGQLVKCGCDRTIYGPAVGFQWAGCSDNVAYGTAFSKIFVDARDSKMAKLKVRSKKSLNSAKSLMNLHNNEAGRKLILDNMRIDCKCHGVSGSCELKTCWRATPTFREIGLLLKKKFDLATEVQLQMPKNGKGLVTLEPKYQHLRQGRKSHHKRSKKRTREQLFETQGVGENDLVFIQPSPNYCEKDEKIGWPGTHGRICNKTSSGPEGCDQLCCGRGYATSIERVKERCNCKFQWCCQVECDQCYRSVELTTCL